jgi:hypothetical protein
MTARVFALVSVATYLDFMQIREKLATALLAKDCPLVCVFEDFSLDAAELIDMIH